MSHSVSSSKGKGIMVMDEEAGSGSQAPHTPTHSTQPNSTNSNSTKEENSTEQKPSIFSDTPYVVSFEHNIKKLRETDNSLRDIFPWKFVEFMAQWHNLGVNAFLKYFRANEALVLSYFHRVGFYDEIYNDQTTNDFLDLLLLNSCIIIFVILSFQNVPKIIEILAGIDQAHQRYRDFYILYQHITSDNPRSVKCGMLDMDRQIPWFVVEAVYTEHSNLSKVIGTPITDLAFSCFGDLYPGVHESKVRDGTVTQPPGGFKHLLHMFHWSRTPEEKYLVETRSLQPIESMDNFYIPSATDLQLSATVFKKHAGIHVSYNDRQRLSGVMHLAPLHIFKYSRETYSNLLRFERGYVNCGFPVTAYIACMVCLLQKEADVKLLRANEIIPRTWNDDRDVLSFVQNFKSTVLPINFQPNGLNTLSEEVMKHHKKRISRYYAFLKTRYCPNPWIIISVIAAVCLFVLTLLQTIYTMRG